MAAATAPRPDPELTFARLTFTAGGGPRPTTFTSAYTGAAPHSTGTFRTETVAVADARDLPVPAALDREGFALRRHRTAVADLYDDSAVRGRYLEETRALIAAATGADTVAVFDHTRRTDGGGRAGVRSPATYIHVDYTDRSGPERARSVLGDEVVARARRLVQVNAWRPIGAPVERSPLAVADARSVVPRDLVATDLVYPDRTGEIYRLDHDPSQRWYWYPRMTPDEVLLLKGYDSETDGRSRFTPHSAFDDPDTAPGAPPRESIEVRAFALYE